MGPSKIENIPTDFWVLLDTIMAFVQKNKTEEAKLEFDKSSRYLFEQAKNLPDGWDIFLFELEEYLRGSDIQQFYGYSDAEYRDYILAEYDDFLKSCGKQK